VEFITNLIRRNKILLGGALEAEARPYHASYMLWIEYALDRIDRRGTNDLR
jgi:hypothetical protein